MQLVRMPSGPWSAAIEIVRPITAALDAVYGVLLCALRPAMDEMLMMEPPPAATMCGMAYLLASTMLLTLIDITWSQSSSDTSTTVPRREIPTLLSRISSRPYRSMQASTMRPAILGIGNVGLNRGRHAAFRMNHLLGFLGPFDGHVGQQNPRALASEQRRRRPPVTDPGPAGAGARYDGNFPSSLPLRSGTIMFSVCWRSRLSKLQPAVPSDQPALITLRWGVK